MIYNHIDTNQLKVNEFHNREDLSKFNQEKKEYEGCLKQMNLKSEQLNYLRKLKDTRSESELLLLIKIAKLKSKENIKNDEKSKKQAIDKKQKLIKKVTTPSSELKDEKQYAVQVSSIESSSETQENSPVNDQPQAVPASKAQTSIQRTDGLNFDGRHYDIKSFSGLGHVPVDECIYQWLDYTEHLHLLAERQSPVGRDVRELAIGSKITVNNMTYTIYNVISGVTNDVNAYNSLSTGKPAITIQSCDSGDDNSTLTIWYAS